MASFFDSLLQKLSFKKMSKMCQNFVLSLQNWQNFSKSHCLTPLFFVVFLAERTSLGRKDFCQTRSLNRQFFSPKFSSEMRSNSYFVCNIIHFLKFNCMAHLIETPLSFMICASTNLSLFCPCNQGQEREGGDDKI